MNLATTAGGSERPSESSPVMQFTTIKELFEEIEKVEKAGGDILTVKGVLPTTGTAIDKERERRRRRIRFRRYMPQEGILIITIPTALHEQLHVLFGEEVLSQIGTMNLRGEWNTMAATTFRSSGGGEGEGDWTGGPRPLRTGRDKWPTLVIEAGASETLDELREDMRWWFWASRHEVKIVLLAKFDRPRRQVQLEKWIEVPPRPRHGATNTRNAPQPEPDCPQGTITITQAAGITDTDPARWNPVSYTVTSGALRLEFNLLFLRAPQPGEGDIVISVQDLQQLAARIWEWV